jgi:hypothetical protein
MPNTTIASAEERFAGSRWAAAASSARSGGEYGLLRGSRGVHRRRRPGQRRAHLRDRGGILRPPGRAWSRPGADAVRCLSSAQAILTARMLDKTWREVPAAVAGRSPRPA